MVSEQVSECAYKQASVVAGKLEIGLWRSQQNQVPPNYHRRARSGHQDTPSAPPGWGGRETFFPGGLHVRRSAHVSASFRCSSGVKEHQWRLQVRGSPRRAWLASMLGQEEGLSQLQGQSARTVAYMMQRSGLEGRMAVRLGNQPCCSSTGLRLRDKLAGYKVQT
jgi:hypothetical protein